MKIKSLIFILFIFSCLFFAFSFYYSIFIPNENFPINKTFTVNKGDSVGLILQNLESSGYIKSSFYAKFLNKLINVNLTVGEYYFDYKASTFQVLTGVNIRQKVYKLTIPEGYTKFQIAEKLENLNLKNFIKEVFLEKAKEGYLFPDTYFLENANTTENILQKMEDNFNNKISLKFPEWNNLNDLQKQKVVIIASILEREARKIDSMKMVSGILENRLEINMPLQVDATVLYGKGVWKERTTFADLKSKTEKEKLYNTYDRVGLPIGPISNPGLNSIEAALNPVNNNFIYYLTSVDGKMHYAKTFEEHVANRKYLR
jgi:UPF0755 protein